MLGGIYLQKGRRQPPQRFVFEGVPILCLPLHPGAGESARRLKRGEKQLKQAGCRHLLLGEGIDPARLPLGHLPLVSALPLRRRLAVPAALLLLEEAGVATARSTAALVAECPTPRLFQQAAELSGHLRYLALSFRRGGERFAFHLQRELGVSARLLQEGELCPAQLVLLYENCPAWEKQGTVNLPLYGESGRPWPVEYVTGEEEHPLFSCFDREKLLSHMLETGVLTEKKVKIRTKKQNT